MEIFFKLKNFKNTLALLTDLKESFTNFTWNFTVGFVELKVDLDRDHVGGLTLTWDTWES